MLDYEGYVKMIFEIKNRLRILTIRITQLNIDRSNQDTEENERLLWMIKNIFYKLASIVVTKDY